MNSNRKNTTVNAADFGFSVAGTGKENVAALQKAIASGETVVVSEPGIYDMAGTVQLPDDTHLRFAKAVVLRRVPLDDPTMEGNLFINAGAYTGAYNENISVSGLHLVINGVESAPVAPESKRVIPGLRGHIAFLYVRHVLVEDVTITDLMAKDYAIQISDFEDAEVRRVHIEGLKDGVHFGIGKHFAVRDSVFRTFDDCIALNSADYSVSNPNFGTIEDGVIENCIDLPGEKTYSFFLRILVGTARPWQKGMTVYHSDAILTKTGMYRVVMRPDNTAYVSETEPSFAEGYCNLDGIQWVRTHKGYAPSEIPATAGCKNIVCRNISLEQPRDKAVMIYTSFDAYLRSYYPGSPIPEVENIRFEDIKVLKPVKELLHINLPVKNVTVANSNVLPSQIVKE